MKNCVFVHSDVENVSTSIRKRFDFFKSQQEKLINLIVKNPLGEIPREIYKKRDRKSEDSEKKISKGNLSE